MNAIKNICYNHIIKIEYTDIMKPLLTILILFLISPNYAFAMGELEFKEIISPIRSVEIDSFLNDQFSTQISDYAIAQTDLNNDTESEYVLKRKHCKASVNNPCNHIILGKTKKTFVILGNIRSKKLVISSTKSHNIKDILAFDNDLNDYEFDIYMWSPNEKMYILKAK